MIVMRNDSTQIEKFAAQELAAYASLMMDKKIGVVDSTSENAIYVGSLPDQASSDDQNRMARELEELHNDGFVIRNVGSDLVIQGKMPRATLYGVYDYLKMLGARWYFPGKEHEFVPKRREIILKEIDLVEAPDIDHRSIVISFENSAFQDWVDFAAKSKLSAIHSISDQNIEQMPSCLASRGLEPGLRRHFYGGTYSTDDRDEIERNGSLMLDYIRGLPDELNDFFLWPADIPLELRDGEESSIFDVILAFTNEMLKTLRTLKPAARMSFLAYWSTWGVPKVSRPVDGVFLEMAPMFRCFAHSIVDPVCSINSKEILPVIEELLQVFDPGESHVLGYWLDASLFGRSRYEALAGRLPQMGEIIKRDLEYYKSKGIYGISTFAVRLNKDYFSRFASPTIFQYPALLWDVKADVESELPSFCQNYYGDSSLAQVFQMNEQMEPKDPDFVNWETLADGFSKAKLIAEEIAKSATDDAHILRLDRLTGELEHMRAWANGMWES